MASPLFRAYKFSRWREDVDRVWKFLHENYVVTTDEHCSTHVHISVKRGYSLQDLRRIAQCIIHFEPAIEALVPPVRRGNIYVKSNWLENPHFGFGEKSPRQAIKMIGDARDRCEVMELMTPQGQKWFAWNFQSLMTLHTIEFRKGAAATTAQQSLAWAELAMTFIQSAMGSGDDDTVDHLNRIPPNVGGLKRFLLRKRQNPHMCDPRYLEPLWTGRVDSDSIQANISQSFNGPPVKRQEQRRAAETERYWLKLRDKDRAQWMVD